MCASLSLGETAMSMASTGKLNFATSRSGREPSPEEKLPASSSPPRSRCSRDRGAAGDDKDESQQGQGLANTSEYHLSAPPHRLGRHPIGDTGRHYIPTRRTKGRKSRGYKDDGPGGKPPGPKFLRSRELEGEANARGDHPRGVCVAWTERRIGLYIQGLTRDQITGLVVPGQPIGETPADQGVELGPQIAGLSLRPGEIRQNAVTHLRETVAVHLLGRPEAIRERRHAERRGDGIGGLGAELHAPVLVVADGHTRVWNASAGFVPGVEVVDTQRREVGTPVS